MKLIIQIPCLNEADTLPKVLSTLPRELPGVDRIEWLVIDDGSTDNTAEVALGHGVDHVVRHTRNQGLASAFMTGLSACLEQGADLIVNTDADNQYRNEDIPALIRPVIEGQADLVIGARPIDNIEHFSALKKSLQKLGSWVVRMISGTEIPDAPSGFRAYSRAAAQRLYVYGHYTYTIETIVQAAKLNLALASVPIGVNSDERPSRLVRSIPRYVASTGTSLLRVWLLYSPLRFFSAIALILGLLSGILLLRFLWFYFTGDGGGHIQSLIVMAVLAISSVLVFSIGILSDLIAANRKLLEDIRHRQVQQRDRQ